MSPTPLDRAIFRTLAYFAYFHYPLTSNEVFCWLLSPDRAYAQEDIERALATSPWLRAHTDTWGVYYSTESCEAWVHEREARYAQALRKHHKARGIARALSWLPGVRGVAICNSLAWHATRAASDIDFFILTRAGHIWTVRMLATAPLKLFGMRAGEAERDPVCLSFFVSEHALDFSVLREGEDDWYLAYWIASLRWLAADAGIREVFYEKNAWIQRVLPNYALQYDDIAPCSFTRTLRVPVYFPEKLARYVQKHTLPRHLHERANTSTHVVLTDSMLKFHEHDTRASIRDFVALTMSQAGL